MSNDVFSPSKMVGLMFVSGHRSAWPDASAQRAGHKARQGKIGQARLDPGHGSTKLIEGSLYGLQASDLENWPVNILNREGVPRLFRGYLVMLSQTVLLPG